MAYWNFNALGVGSTAQVMASDTGSATIYADGTNGSSALSVGGSNPEISSDNGSTTNALGGDAAGYGMKIANQSANGKSVVIKFSMSGYSGLSISYAVRRAAGTGASGFTTNTWALSTDGTNFQTLATVDVTGASSFTAIDPTSSPTSALDGAQVAYLRITFTGATGSNARNVIDNLQLNATAMPSPGALALLGAAGMVAGRRRRS